MVSPPPSPAVVPLVLMDRPLTPDGDRRQTIINTLAWMQNNIRKGMYAKPSEYYGKSGEDVMA